MKKDFWDMSWNPVWGCLNTCPYCYARRIAKRYAEQIAEKEINYLFQKENFPINQIPYIKSVIIKTLIIKALKNFKPTWLESNYVREFPKKSSIIFVNSMSDPAYWEQEWYEKIVKSITKNMQHTFVVLTKKPEVYKKYTFPHNTILGVTITNYHDCIDRLSGEMLDMYENLNNKLLISIEPMQNTFRMVYLESLKKIFDWIHVGQESGNRIYRIRATRGMIQPFFWLKEIPVFMKNNLEIGRAHV